MQVRFSCILGSLFYIWREIRVVSVQSTRSVVSIQVVWRHSSGQSTFVIPVIQSSRNIKFIILQRQFQSSFSFNNFILQSPIYDQAYLDGWTYRALLPQQLNQSPLSLQTIRSISDWPIFVSESKILLSESTTICLPQKLIHNSDVLPWIVSP